MADIEALKKAHEEIYKVNILNYSFIFRPVTRQEYKDIIDRDLTIGDIQDAVCSICVLDPCDYDFSEGLAGIGETLSDMILDVSGLLPGQGQSLLDEYRSELFIFDYQADCIITEAFPQFSLEELQNWTVRKTLMYLSRAEWKLINLRSVPLQEMMQVEEQAPPPPQQSPKQQVQVNETQETPEGQLSKEQVEAMMSQSMGKPIDLNSEPGMNQLFPELSWFKAEEQLKGEFD